MLSATAIPRVETPTLARMPASVIVAKRAPSTAADHTRQRWESSAYQSQFCASHGPSALSQRPTVVHSAIASSSVRPLSAPTSSGSSPAPERERLELRRERRVPARGALEHASAEAPHVIEVVPGAREHRKVRRQGERHGLGQGGPGREPSRPRIGRVRAQRHQRGVGERGHAGRVEKSLAAKWHSRRVPFGRRAPWLTEPPSGTRGVCHLAVAEVTHARSAIRTRATADPASARDGASARPRRPRRRRRIAQCLQTPRS